MFTIHDSVVTTLEYQDVVVRVVNDVIFEAIGVSPKVHIESWQNTA